MDPSHGIGINYGVAPLARAAVAVGADGVIVEVHNEPEKALSDGQQALLPKEFDKLMRQIKAIHKIVNEID